MLKKGLSVLMILFVLSFIVLFSNSVLAQEKIRLKFAGCIEGGGTYRSALAISEIVNKYSKRLELSVQSSPGTLETPRMLEAGMVQMAQGSSSGEMMSTDGIGGYEGKPTKMVRRMLVWGEAVYLIFAPANKNITSIEDLVGKKIGLGASTSPTGETAAKALELMGLAGKAKWYNNTSATELGERIKDGMYDAGFYGVAQPWSVLLDLTSGMKMNFFGITGENLDKVVKWSKGRYFPVEMPANVYPNQPNRIQTFGTLQTTLVRADVPDDVVMEILDLLDNHFEEFRSAYPPAGLTYHDFNIQANEIAPLHPGTIAWIKKHGGTVK
jgi:TRAP transporter TAXI family solute receptor